MKKSLNKKFFEDLKARLLTEKEQEIFSRLIYNQNFCSAGEMEAKFKKIMSMEESEFDKLADHGMALFEGFYSYLEEADKKGRAIDVLRKHRNNANDLLGDCYYTPQDSFFYEMAGFLNMIVHIIEQFSGSTIFPLSAEQFLMLIKPLIEKKKSPTSTFILKRGGPDVLTCRNSGKNPNRSQAGEKCNLAFTVIAALNIAGRTITAGR